MGLENIGSTLNSDLKPPITYVISSFLSVALYNVLELTFILFLTFKHRSGLYFWSFFVSTWGIASYSVGFFLKDFHATDSIPYFYTTLIIVGWSMMVTGQSLVLYSRLHLIVHNRTVLRSILGMIIIDVIILQIPTIILCYGANSALYRRFAFPYAVYERIQVTIFFVQETLISSVYLYVTFKFLLSERVFEEGTHGDPSRRLMLNLIYMNLIVVLLDMSILALEYAGRYASQTAAKGLIYSVKLKLEFNILNRLVEFVRRPSNLDPGFYDPFASQHDRCTQQMEQANGEVRQPS